MRHVGDQERRDRIALRHGIAPAHRLEDAVAATRAMTVLHATEPPTVYLSVAQRVEGIKVSDIDAALFDDRSLVRQLAMRRTLFVFPRDLLPAAWGSASARVAGQERRKIARDAAASGLAAAHAGDGEAWLEAACAAVLAVLEGEDRGLTTTEVRARVPEVAGTVSVAPGTKWGGDVPIAPRVLTLLGVSGAIVRGGNDGHWRVSRHLWTPMDRWLGAGAQPLPEDEGYAELVRRWLATFGPGTIRDLQWWLGSTVGAVKKALATLGAVEVSLDGGATGWLLPDDLDGTPAVEPWAALLPVLDPTTMGWKERDFYLEPRHTPYLFDSNGNGGTTAWWDGRVVGCWVQDDDAVVQVVLREDVGADGRAALDVEAERLTAWLDGVRISTVYSSHQMKSALLP
ncbi:winged helix DNA-binding domain-containing protein [Nocardioides guangzhouensis]|uniref:Winged helix DNA-binding domain-containing protein n=1 Tax=Nocardioides guangzhouensis TaxID=2497878 RepID=A0A4Q4ZMW2_9ACTN|nr:winged helix DNA-binding domain-containing protein [Nocardioides guangzhouensis]RYP88961.1 winged helix DNA-binding domain-containing protein [Nocardioides guangzhouensis]